MTRRLIIFLVAAWAAAAAAAAAVTVTARVPATGDKQADHDAALALARKLAVEQAVGVLVDARVRLENQLMLQDKILTRAAGLVRNEAIGREGPVEPGLYELELTCEVDEIPLEDLLDNVKRSVVVRVTAADAAEGKAAATVGAVIRGVLADADYKCLDEAYLTEAREGRPDMLSGDELKAVGRKYLAQVIVYGEVAAVAAGELEDTMPYVEGNPLAGLKIARVEADLKAVETSSGRVLAEKVAGPREFVGFGDDLAAARADAYARFAAAAGTFFAGALAPKETP